MGGGSKREQQTENSGWCLVLGFSLATYILFIPLYRLWPTVYIFSAEQGLASILLAPHVCPIGTIHGHGHHQYTVLYHLQATRVCNIGSCQPSSEHDMCGFSENTKSGWAREKIFIQSLTPCPAWNDQRINCCAGNQKQPTCQRTGGRYSLYRWPSSEQNNLLLHNQSCKSEMNHSHYVDGLTRNQHRTRPG